MTTGEPEAEADLPPAVADAFESLRAGTTQAQAALRAGVSTATLNRWIKRYAFKLPPSPTPQRQPAILDGLLLHLATQGWLHPTPADDDWNLMLGDAYHYARHRGVAHLTRRRETRGRSRHTSDERAVMAEQYRELRSTVRDWRVVRAWLAERQITALQAGRWVKGSVGVGALRQGKNSVGWLREQVLDALRKNPEGCTVTQLAEGIGASLRSVYQQLLHLGHAGLVLRPGRGGATERPYRIHPDGPR